jgi:hypothetical protein
LPAVAQVVVNQADQAQVDIEHQHHFQSVQVSP